MDKKYITLNYRNSFENDEYEDPEILLNKSDKKLFEAEREHIESLGIKIVHEYSEYGFIVFEDKQEYKQPPYLNIEPDWYESSIDGFPCNCCIEYCSQYDKITTPENAKPTIILQTPNYDSRRSME